MKNLHLVTLVVASVCFIVAAIISRNDTDKLLVRLGLAAYVATYFLV